MTDVRFITDPDSEWITVNFRFDRDVIDIVKLASAGLRNYDPSTKSWSVHESVGEQVIESLIAAGHQVLHGDEPPPEPAKSYDELDGFFALSSDSDKALIAAKVIEMAEAFDKLAPAIRHKVFRGLSKHLYPEMYARK
jgi:hypothetical protein